MEYQPDVLSLCEGPSLRCEVIIMSSDQAVLIRARSATLDGRLTVPEYAPALILIVGLGGTYHHERLRHLAAELQIEGFATLFADLLTADEQQFDSRTGHFRVDALFLAGRICEIARWLCSHDETRHLPLGILASGFSASAALTAMATDLQPFAVVVYAPRIDSIGARLERNSHVPLLLLEDDPAVSVPDDERDVSRAAQEAVGWFARYAPVVTAT